MTSSPLAFAETEFESLQAKGARGHSLHLAARVRHNQQLGATQLMGGAAHSSPAVNAFDLAGLRTAEAIFLEVRPQLLRIASRSMSDSEEAEDIVQEAWIRWQRCDRTAVRDPRAFLAATTARLSSNAAQSARARHETYIHTWPREPVDAAADPALATERGEAIDFALRLALDGLSPSERAAFVLRHAFGYPYARIAQIIHQTEASVRQHVSRAHRRLAARPHAAMDGGKHERIVNAFVAAAQEGNLLALEQLFAADVSNRGRRTGLARRTASLSRTAFSRALAATASDTTSNLIHIRSPRTAA
jgi:RNA polymerase sigma factor (sigma-70 family)